MVESSILGSFDLNSQADIDLGLGLPWGQVSKAKFATSTHHNRPLHKRALYNGGHLLHHLPLSCLLIKSHPSHGFAHTTRSSAGSPSSGLLLLSAAAASSGSGAPDCDLASTAPHSCLACWQAANAPTVHLDRPGLDLVEIRASIQAIQASLQVVEDSVARDSAVDDLREDPSALTPFHAHAAELHLQIESAGTTAQAFSQFCQDRHDRLLHRLERANELLTLRDADAVNMEERIVHTEDRLRELKRQ
ncbi:unnamed protein product [Phytophthora fragariaefolia]|uniref:Unnamed protein product n=1 Tax=Phytophthora fragariaefolia TaxID=1490495 RepID=A0A9W7CTF0_9STRA|nr:unnamed protein product [Phytophthora fragariaefolia]